MNNAYPSRPHRTPRDHRRAGRFQGFMLGLVVGLAGREGLQLIPAGCGTLKLERVEWDGRRPLIHAGDAIEPLPIDPTK